MDKRFPLGDQIDMLAAALRGRIVAPVKRQYDPENLFRLNQNILPAA